MTKMERLEEIESQARQLRLEIEQDSKRVEWELFQEDCGIPRIDKVKSACKINQYWAYTIFKTSDRLMDNGSRDNPPALYLTNCQGVWTDDQGNNVQGYLTFTPR